MATAGKGARDTAAGQRKDRDKLRYNGYVLIKGKRLKSFELQFGHIINEATKPPYSEGRRKGKTPHPPPAEEAKGPLTPLKIRAIFFDKPFSMQLNLAKSQSWSPKSRG